MQSTTIPSVTRRRCLCQLRQSAKAGSSPIDTEMAENLGVAIDLSGGEVHTANLLPTLSSPSEDVFLGSYDVACYLRDLMVQSTNIDGTRKFLEWPNSCRFWEPYFGFSTIMTNADQAEALIVTVHSRAATDNEMLNTEFVACYLAARAALDYDDVHQELKEAPTQGNLRKKWTEYNELGFRSPMQGLPIRLVSIHGQDIRILTTCFTDEYYQSFKMLDQSPSGSLRVRIESFRLPDYEKAEVAHILQKLMKTSNK